MKCVNGVEFFFLFQNGKKEVIKKIAIDTNRVSLFMSLVLSDTEIMAVKMLLRWKMESSSPKSDRFGRVCIA